MLNVSRPWSVRSLFFCLSLLACVSASIAYAQAPQTEWDRQLARMQLGATAIGIITPQVAGTNTLNPPNQMHITQDGSQTVGVLGTLRYTKSPSSASRQTTASPATPRTTPPTSSEAHRPA